MIIEIIGAHSPRWANIEKTAINLMATFSHLPNMELEFTADHADTAEHGIELFLRAKFGEYGEVAPYGGPESDELEAVKFPAKRAQAMATTEARIAPLERARRLGVATPEELAELEALERHTITLMRAEGPALPVFSYAH